MNNQSKYKKQEKILILIVLSMFLITQFIGLYVTHNANLPAYLNPQLSPDIQISPQYYFYQIISSFIFAFLIFVLITKFKLRLIMKIWFFSVVVIALSISISTILFKLFSINIYWIALFIALILASLKVFRPSIISHNATELLIYPGIAAIFVPLLNPFFIIILLIIISAYDIWAVWHSKIMMKMAKFQMNELRVFGGFFVPYLTKEIRQKIENLKKSKNKNKKLIKLKIPTIMLGGGDIFYPIFTSGVFFIAFGIWSALAVIFGAFAGLSYLLFTRENKPYPAMPYITTGIFIGLVIWAIFKFLI
jgi:presenilin-like A22 family membrane protease